MRYLLDTNVLSELVKRRPDRRVTQWIDAQSPLDLAISVLSLGEVEKGIARLPHGTRRLVLTRWTRRDLPTQFTGRVLDINAAVAVTWGELSGQASVHARPLPVIDGLLLATAHVYVLTLVTRNVSDCAARGVPVFDPWSGTLHD